MEKDNKSNAANLRQKAEELLRMKLLKTGLQFPEAEMQKLIHELGVHQIELELQNEELTLAKEQAEVASERYTELYDSAPSGYFTLSPDGEIIELNLCGAQILGKERSNLKNSMFGFFVSDETKPIFNHFLEKIFTGRAKESCEVALSMNGKSPIVVHLTGIVAKNGEQCFITAIDITERKLAEESRLKSEEKYRLLVENTHDIIFTVNLDGVFTFVSPAWTSLLGHPINLVVGKSFQQFVHPEDTMRCMQMLQKVIETGQRQEGFEYRVQHIDGAWHWHTSNSASIKDETGTLVGFYGIARDITERKQVEEEQQRITERLSLACRAGGIGIWELDVVNNNLIWDDQMFKLYGIMPDQFTGTYETWRAGVLPDDLPGSEEELKMALSGSKDFNAEFRVVWPDGTIHSIRALADVQRDSSGNAVGLIGTNYDITETKLMELEIRHKNEELQKLNAEKDKFFSIIAHDLKSPFNSFLGLTQIMAEELPSLTMEQVQEITVSMSKSAANLYRLLENLLQWSRIQQGSIPFNPKLLQLFQVVEECIETIKEPAKNKGIEITSDIPGNLEVFADSHMLQTVIRNMVSNAEKFTPKGGKISVAAKILNDNSVEISVKDTGIGMNLSMVGNLFRLDVPTNRKGTEGEPSSGLGLFLCHEFIKKHGGKIGVESDEGKGSEFKFTLPVAN